jgi:hypothetical protein
MNLQHLLGKAGLEVHFFGSKSKNQPFIPVTVVPSMK